MDFPPSIVPKFPWLDKMCNKIGVKLSVRNKWFIGVVNLFIAAYLINPEEVSYYKCILPIVLMRGLL